MRHERNRALSNIAMAMPELDETARRELTEELGIDTEVRQIAAIPACENTGSEFVRVYRAEHDGPFSLPPAEIECGGWFTVPQIDRWIAARPQDFGIPKLVQELARRCIPTFGVCLGLQGIVEAFGGELDVLDYPMHGKGSLISHYGRGVFHGLPSPFRVGRYHSLHANRETFPECLEITAESEDGVIMGIRHRDLPIEAVQFHPESILTLERDCGIRLVENMIERYARAAVGAEQT